MAKKTKKAQAKKKARAVLPAIAADAGTTATRQRLRRDPVDDYAAGLRRREDRLVGEKESAAREIRRIYGMITAGLWSKAVDMNAVRGGGDPAPEWLAIAHRDRYKPWADEQGRSERLAVVMDWLIDEHTMAQIDRERRQRKGCAAEMIDDAMLRYAQIAGWVGRVVRAA